MASYFLWEVFYEIPIFSVDPGASDLHNGVWWARIPLKIEIFLWQAIRSQLPASDQIIKRHGNVNMSCSLCGEIEESYHILFSYVLAKLFWSCVWSWPNINWNPSSFADLLGLVAALLGQSLHCFWLALAAQCWALWTTRNKLTIEHVFPNKPSHCLFKMLALLQQWKRLVRARDVDAIDLMIDRVCTIGSTLLPAGPASPTVV